MYDMDTDMDMRTGTETCAYVYSTMCVSVGASGGMKYSSKVQARAGAGERKVYSERGGALSLAYDVHSELRLGSGHGLL